MAQRASRADFEAVFPSLVQDLTDHANQYGIPAVALEWFQKVWLSSPGDIADLA